MCGVIRSSEIVGILWIGASIRIGTGAEYLRRLDVVNLRFGLDILFLFHNFSNFINFSNITVLQYMSAGYWPSQ